MTHEEAFENLKGWAKIFGYPIEEARFAEWPEELEVGTRGFFQADRINSPGWIWVKLGLPSEIRTGVLAHEVGHMALFIMSVEPYQRATHEPTASLLGHCFLAVIQEDFQNPLLHISGIAKSVKLFLELLKGKVERTSRNLARMEIAYYQWKKEAEGIGA